MWVHRTRHMATATSTAYCTEHSLSPFKDSSGSCYNAKIICLCSLHFKSFPCFLPLWYMAIYISIYSCVTTPRHSIIFMHFAVLLGFMPSRLLYFYQWLSQLCYRVIWVKLVHTFLFTFEMLWYYRIIIVMLFSFLLWCLYFHEHASYYCVTTVFYIPYCDLHSYIP